MPRWGWGWGKCTIGAIPSLNFALSVHFCYRLSGHQLKSQFDVFKQVMPSAGHWVFVAQHIRSLGVQKVSCIPLAYLSQVMLLSADSIET